MKTLNQITEDLIDDALDTCRNDFGYMKSILRSYFEGMTEDERRKAHQDAFDTPLDECDENQN